MTGEATWETLKFDNDYEICTEYPYQIRRKSDGYVITEFIRNNYIAVCLNCIICSKHRVIAFQWIVNDDPDSKTQVDHKNKIYTDNHISNLRWVTPHVNNMNKSSYNGIECEYVDDLPIDVTPIIWYNGFEFDGYFMDSNGDIWYDTGANFRKLHISKKNQVCIRDINHKRHDFGIKGLRREFM